MSQNVAEADRLATPALLTHCTPLPWEVDRPTRALRGAANGAGFRPIVCQTLADPCLDWEVARSRAWADLALVHLAVHSHGQLVDAASDAVTAIGNLLLARSEPGVPLDQELRLLNVALAKLRDALAQAQA